MINLKKKRGLYVEDSKDDLSSILDNTSLPSLPNK